MWGDLRAVWLQHTAGVLLRGALERGERRRALREGLVEAAGQQRELQEQQAEGEVEPQAGEQQLRRQGTERARGLRAAHAGARGRAGEGAERGEGRVGGATSPVGRERRTACSSAQASKRWPSPQKELAVPPVRAASPAPRLT